MSDRPDRREAGLAAIRGALAAADQIEVDPATWLRLRNETLACLSLPTIRQTRKWPVTPVAATDPTGSLYAFVGADGDVQLRRVSDGEELSRIKTSGIAIDPIHFSPAGHYLGARIEKNEQTEAGYRLYSVSEGQLQWSFSTPVRWNRVAFTPDERQIVLVDFEGRVHRLDTASGEQLGVFETGLGDDCEMALHPDGDKIAFAHQHGQGQNIFIHDLATGERLAELTFPFPVWCLAWSPDGTRIAVGSGGLFSLWEVPGPTLLRTFSGHRRLITRITFHQDGRLIATCGYDGATRIWDAETGEALARLPSYSAYFAQSSGELIVIGSAAGQNALEWWNVEMPRELTTLSVPDVSGIFPRSLDFSSDGSIVVAAGDDGVRVWDCRSSRFQDFLPLPGAFGVTRVPEPGRLLLGSSLGLSELCADSGTNQPAPGQSDVSTIARRFAITTLQEGHSAQDAVFHRVAVSQDGHRIAWIRDRGRLVLWDRSTDVVREISVSGDVPCVAVHPSGQWFVSSDADGLAVWDFASGVRDRTLGDTYPWCKATFDAVVRGWSSVTNIVIDAGRPTAGSWNERYPETPEGCGALRHSRRTEKPWQSPAPGAR